MLAKSRPNRAALSAALDIYRDAMRPFIVRCLRHVPGEQVEDLIVDALGDRQANDFLQNLHNNGGIEAAIDINYFPNLIGRNWRSETFSAQFNNDKSVLNQLWLITDARNKAAHPGTEDIDAEYVRTHLFLIGDVLERINAPEEKKAVEDLRAELSTGAVPSTSSDSEPEVASVPAVKTTPQPASSSRNLRPWREVAPPNSDVTLGSFRDAEFAADLQQVYDGRATVTEYGNPVQFFHQTYITPSMRELLVNTLQLLGGKGGDPIVQAKTGFGGGKTHSLIALYHLVDKLDTLINLPQDSEYGETGKEIRKIVEAAGWDANAGIQPKISVLVGTYLSTTDPRTTREKEDPLNTLWGTMAYQLGGQAAYDIIGDAARQQGLAPGGVELDLLFEHIGPCVILIDELVNYVINAGGTQSLIYTFIQVLTEAVKRARNVALVVTLPESEQEAGGSDGAEALETLESRIADSQEALEALESRIARNEVVWKPLEINEAYEVVRRRLFGNAINEKERDRTCEAFARMYSRAKRDYPEGVWEQNYLARMKACYPIHPEIFDRLYEDWSAIHDFQRTRGVLRLMANCIRILYGNRDASPMILPANLPLSEGRLANELGRLLPDNYEPVVSEVDSDDSQTSRIDNSSERFLKVGRAARRIARTIFLGSASSGAVRGIDERRIRLGTMEPGHGVSVYSEALKSMVGQLHYLYLHGDRYFFHAQENLNLLARNRANALTNEEVNAEILRHLRHDAVFRHYRPEVVICPKRSDEVPDEDKIQLVVLPPDISLPSRSSENDNATETALRFLHHCGDAIRIRKNTLLFLTAKRDDIRELTHAVKNYLAWHSIVNDEEWRVTLDGERFGQADQSLLDADYALRAAVMKSYRQGLAPAQPEPQKAEYQFTAFQTDAVDTGDLVRSAFTKFIEEEALVENMSSSSLANLLNQYVWNNENYRDHIGINELWDMMTRCVYLPRLRNKGVLLNCIEQGVPNGTFGYAESYENDTYHGIRYAEPLGTGIAESRDLLLVNPEMAELIKQQQEEEASVTPPVVFPSQPKPPDGHVPSPSVASGPVQLVATKTMENDISLDQVNLLRDEVLHHLRAAGGDVRVTITVTARNADGFSENAVRSVKQNCETLDVEVTETKGF